jgi:hypothetical protein
MSKRRPENLKLNTAEKIEHPWSGINQGETSDEEREGNVGEDVNIMVGLPI